MFCIKCGKKVNKRTLVCKNCGAVATLEGIGGFDEENAALMFSQNSVEESVAENEFMQQISGNQTDTVWKRKKSIIIVIAAAVVFVTVGIVTGICLMDDEEKLTAEKNVEERQTEDETPENENRGILKEETTVRSVEDVPKDWQGEEEKINVDDDAFSEWSISISW